MHSLCRLLFLIQLFYIAPKVLLADSTLPASELNALISVADSLNKTGWDFRSDPCQDSKMWVDAINSNYNVSCDCSIAGVEGCHIVAIILNYENLDGVLPGDLSGLPYLQILDLKYNYLHGIIPPEWGSSQLVNISLTGNRLTGPIPAQIGNISTLKQLAVEYNQLSGELPNELGKLTNIQNLLLTANNFTGLLPDSLGNLVSLLDFRIGGNPFTGTIPTFLRNFKNLTRLIIQGTNLSGSIPNEIKFLTNLTDLRISDLINATESPFPPLEKLTKLDTLILRNCNLTGLIPDYIGRIVSSYEILDLSFNKLSGPIPGTFASITNTRFMYLTNNRLNGNIPNSIFEKNKPVDLSYNNFSINSTCQSSNVNLFASSSMNNLSNIVPCLQIGKCPKYHYKMNIDCGSSQLYSIKKTHYDADSSGGPSTTTSPSNNWVVSNTGSFVDTNSVGPYIIQANDSKSLYSDARISPLSVTYYGYCLGNGNYTVKLHFAEIKFTNDRTYKSLGRRIFDIYVQGDLVHKDFNIQDQPSDDGKVVIKVPALVVLNTLEIRFYWAGKGTTGIPANGVYGPLISAITVYPNFRLPSEGLSTPSIVGISVAGFVAVCLVLFIARSRWRANRKSAMEEDLKGMDLRTGSFTLRQIKAATNNFDPANKIGEGGFGSVFKGRLSDGTAIAVKQLSSVSKQGSREFVNEIGMISALHHPNLVRLYGCCIESNQLILVYEYMENNSLSRAMHGPGARMNLDWPTRHRICIGIARGLAFLHEESSVRIVHRDIKLTNVLLDKNLTPKISDFGLAKLNETDNTHIITRVAGTYGYMAPEYAMRGQLTSKADVYSFGIVVLEIVSGKSNTSFKPKEEDCYDLLDWALLLKQRGKLLELIDDNLGLEYDQDEVVRTIHVALLCLNVSPAIRPAMSAVVSMLEGSAPVEDVQPVIQPALQTGYLFGPWAYSSTFNDDDLYTPRLVASEDSILYGDHPSDSQI